MPVRGHEQLVGPVGRSGDPGPPTTGPVHHQVIGGWRAECAAVGRQLVGRDRGDLVVGVDLAVRVGDGGAHLRAPVLEHEHVVDVVAGAERGGPLGPEVDDPAGTRPAQVGEGGVVVRGVEHDLGPVVGHRRPAVGERLHVVGLRGLEATDAERALVRMGLVGPVLTGRHDPDPRPRQWIHPPVVGAHPTLRPSRGDADPRDGVGPPVTGAPRRTRCRPTRRGGSGRPRPRMPPEAGSERKLSGRSGGSAIRRRTGRGPQRGGRVRRDPTAPAARG